MIYAFFESIKYVGHLFPIAFLRVYLGYFWVHSALETYKNGQMVLPGYLDDLKIKSMNINIPVWYKYFLENFVFFHWSNFVTVLITAQFLVGLSLVMGFLVRPMSLIGILISLHYVYLGGDHTNLVYMTFVSIFVTLLWVGAGRCLGFDYFFYKRNRGIWW